MSCKIFSKLSWACVLICAGCPCNIELSAKTNLSCPGGTLGHLLGTGMTEYPFHMIAAKVKTTQLNVMNTQMEIMDKQSWASFEGHHCDQQYCNSPSVSSNSGHWSTTERETALDEARKSENSVGHGEKKKWLRQQINFRCPIRVTEICPGCYKIASFNMSTKTDSPEERNKMQKRNQDIDQWQRTLNNKKRAIIAQAMKISGHLQS